MRLYPRSGAQLAAACGALASGLLAFNIWAGHLVLALLNLLLVAFAGFLLFWWGWLAGVRRARPPLNPR